jgi:hypothetical protein
MIRTKPSNISNFFAPTGSSTKIADYGFAKKEISQPTVTTVSYPLPEIPIETKKDNTVFYILLGVTAAIGIVLYLDYREREIFKKMKQREYTT